MVDVKVIQARANICELCTHQRGGRCLIDAKPIREKVTQGTASCPEGLWPGDAKPTPGTGKRAGVTDTPVGGFGVALPYEGVQSPPSGLFRVDPPQKSQSKHQPGPVLEDEVIRIALFSPSLKSGGAERWMLSLAQWLPLMSESGGKRVEVVAVVITSPTEISPQMTAEMSRWAPVIRAEQIDLPETRDLLRTASTFVVWGYGPLAQYVEPYPDAKIVWVSHGACDWTRQHLLKCRDSVTHWAGVSEMSRRVFPSDLAPKMTVLHNGADVARCSPVEGRAAIRAKWGVTDDQIVVGYIGRFSPEKRPEALAEAIVQLPTEYVGVMVGGGWREVETKALCDSIAGHRVKFVGHASHVGDALAGIDVWINASPSEGFCLSLIEAWLAGVPAVSTPTGAVPELTAQYGDLVQPIGIGATPREIATAIIRATSKSKTVTERVNWARKVAWDSFTAPAMGARWVKYLREIHADDAPFRPADPYAADSIDQLISIFEHSLDVGKRELQSHPYLAMQESVFSDLETRWQRIKDRICPVAQSVPARGLVSR